MFRHSPLSSTQAATKRIAAAEKFLLGRFEFEINPFASGVERGDPEAPDLADAEAFFDFSGRAAAGFPLGGEHGAERGHINLWTRGRCCRG